MLAVVFGNLLDLFGAERLAMGTVAADLGSRQKNLKTEMRFHLPPQALQGLAKELLDLAAAEADDVGVFLLQPGLVVMLVSGVMHEIQLIHETAFFEQLQRTVHGDAVQFGIAFVGHSVQAFGVEMLPGLIDQIEKDLALAREPDPALAQ
jgi:hypothetical protein